MIFRNGKLILEAHREVIEIKDDIQKQVQKKIGAIYKGANLVWITIYNTIKSCFGSGTWYGDKPWIGTDEWTTNN